MDQPGAFLFFFRQAHSQIFIDFARAQETEKRGNRSPHGSLSDLHELRGTEASLLSAVAGSPIWRCHLATGFGLSFAVVSGPGTLRDECFGSTKLDAPSELTSLLKLSEAGGAEALVVVVDADGVIRYADMLTDSQDAAKRAADHLISWSRVGNCSLRIADTVTATMALKQPT